MTTSLRDQARTRPSRRGPDPVTAGIGLTAVLGVVLWAVVGKRSFDRASAAALAWVLANFSWLFVVAADVFLLLCLALAASRFGRLRLGPEDSRPDYRNLSWIAMMFSAGMGIGLMFYGVAEPLQHYLSPPPVITGVSPRTPAAAGVALAYSFFHWTLTPWAIYGITALALGWAGFRKGRGFRLSAVFEPVLGRRRAAGWQGRAIDLLAVFATVFGTATSLGVGAVQVATGLHLTVGTRNTTAVQLIVILALGAAFVVSAFSGLDKGVKWLSTGNVVLAACLMAFVFVAGPTVYILNALPATMGNYLDQLAVMATRTGAFSDSKWLGSWTVFYWAWWMSWAPFVGTFIARISRGRTIRQFLVGVLLVPSGASMVWFCVMGGTALRLDGTGRVDMAAQAAKGSEGAFFSVLDALPAGTVTSWVALVLIMTYFVTSADSASLVMGALTSRDSLEPPRWLVVLWGAVMAGVAASLLLAGGLSSLQSATILVGLPFSVLMLGLCWVLLRELRSEVRSQVRDEQSSEEATEAGSRQSTAAAGELG